jgi:hypothetical protein
VKQGKEKDAAAVAEAAKQIPLNEVKMAGFKDHEEALASHQENGLHEHGESLAEYIFRKRCMP